MNIKIRNASVTLGANTILEEVNFEIHDREKIAIVGRNGAGKTTLLKALINNEMFDEGVGEDKFSITKLGKWTIGYLEQITFDDNITLLEEVEKSFSDLINMEKKLETYVHEMNVKNDDKLIKQYTELQESFRLLGGYSYKKEYEVMLNKFGFSDADKLKTLGEFSGGQKTKIAFIKLLLSKPDLLLLDEPTNHLDIDAIEWLENYLKNITSSLIIVSHDRMFLDRIVDTVYEIDYGRTVKYSGNYSYYEREKNLNYERQLKNYEYQQKEIKRLQAIYERFRFKPSKASMALSKLRQIEKMDLIEKPNEIDKRTFRTNLETMEPSVKKVMKLNKVVIGYDKPLATIDLEILRGKKIGVIGGNGIGKSTLLKTINGLITPLDGSIEYGIRVKPGYFDQNLAMQDSNNTVLEEFRSFLPNITLEGARSALGSFLFKGEDVYKPLSVLSGGESVRLQLCKILYNKPNFLILDEPTNHMDIVGKEHLEDILTEYTGTVIFVSHDRYFVKKIADELLVFENDGVKYYKYGYDEYEKNKLENVPVVLENKKEKKINKEEPEKVNVYNVRKELNKVENEIIKLEVKLNKLESELFKEEVYSDFNKSSEVNKKIDNINVELSELNKKWEELCEQVMSN